MMLFAISLDGKERIFARTKAVIGRTVQNCHPPQSVHVVEKLLQDFKSGVKDVEDFWIPVKDMFVYIRYFAVRDEEGNIYGYTRIHTKCCGYSCIRRPKKNPF